MSVPSTTINIHHVYRVAARCPGTIGGPVKLHCATTGDHGDVEVTIFLGDQALADRLVEAVNAAMALKPEPTLVCPKETAAYAAQHEAFNGGSR